jgi:hypothetical protein
MTRVTVHESPEITMWCYPDDGVVHHEMHLYCYGDPLNSALLKGVEALQQYGATKWLSDDRKNGALPPEAEEWGRMVWFPRARAAGWKTWAVLPPSLVAGKMNLGRFVKMYADRGIEVKTFTDPAVALEWLRSR